MNIYSDKTPYSLDINSATTHMLCKLPSSVTDLGQGHDVPAGESQSGRGSSMGGLRIQGWYKQDWPGRYILKDRAVERVDESGVTPCVTVITVVFNAADTLESTIESVLGQDYPNVEYIIVDGGSTDGTLELIKKYSDKIDYWISEPDHGIYNAMNKGIKASRGDVIGLLNANDTYSKDTISRSIAALGRGYDYSYGGVTVKCGNGAQLNVRPMTSDELADKGLYEMGIPHVTLFVKREVYAQIGLYDESFRISADHDLVNRIIVSGRYRGVEVTGSLAQLQGGGISSGIKGKLEAHRVARKAGAPFMKSGYMFLRRVAWHYIVAFLERHLSNRQLNTIRRVLGSRYTDEITHSDTK